MYVGGWAVLENPGGKVLRVGGMVPRSVYKFTCNPYVFIMTSHPWLGLSLSPQNQSSPQPQSLRVLISLPQ